jgi:hypothetical protein
VIFFAASRLAEALRCRTVSYDAHDAEGRTADPAEFDKVQTVRPSVVERSRETGHFGSWIFKLVLVSRSGVARSGFVGVGDFE